MWSAHSLRKRWNQVEEQVAPWCWAEAASGRQTAPARRGALNCVNHPGRVAA
jgi:hypothetical protein